MAPELQEVDLSGRNAIVTGGAKGIGLSVSRALLDAGMNVMITGRDEAALQAVSTEHDRLSGFRCDNGEPTQIDALFAAARKRFGRLHLLVNNAGIGRFGPCEAVTVDDWDQVMQVNARGTFFCAQHAFRWMQEDDGGCIINIASVVGYKAYAQQSVYAASKHAVMGMSKGMAIEGQAHNIRVKALCPGGVATEMVAAARPDLNLDELMKPSDIARAVLFLAREPATSCIDFMNLRRANSTPFA